MIEDVNRIINNIKNKENYIYQNIDSTCCNQNNINNDKDSEKYNKDKLRNTNLNKNNFDLNYVVVNKKTINDKEKEIKQKKYEIELNENNPGKPARRSITSNDINIFSIKDKINEGSLIDQEKIPKKNDSNILAIDNSLGNKGNSISSINSIREIGKNKNNNKAYHIIDKNRNTFLSQQIKSDSKNIILYPQKEPEDNRKFNEQNKDFIEIIKFIDINKPDIYDNMKINEEIKIYDTFCIGVFISGISPPIKNTSIIENSEYFIAPCGHLQCSLYPSIQPQLLNTYINKNMKNFNNLSHLVANMCFPLGIKPCFGCRFDENNKIDNLPNPQQVFFNIIKNEKNETYYISTLQYFIKMSNSEYLTKYKFNPITYFLEKSGNNSNNKDKKFKTNMQMISNSLNNDNIFIPESISLISKYPLLIPMDKCLRCMISLQTEDMNNLINYLVNEVPSPKKNYQIQFFIPKIQYPIILNHEYNKFLSNKNNINKDLNNNNILSASQINVKFLIEKISIENIIMIFQLILLEQKLLFLENNYQILSEISFIFLELIYPLIWINPFLPVLSIKTVQFLQSPVPYIMGLDEYLFKYANESKSIYLGTDMIIFNLMNNQFISSKTKKRIHKKDIFHEFILPTIPDEIGDYIYKELKNLKKIMEKMEKHKNKKENVNHEIISDEELDKKIRLIFLKALIMLFGDYNNFLFYTEDEIPLFNKEAFVQSHKDKNSQLFLAEMVKTQIFNQFLLNEKQLYIKTKNKLRDISSNNYENTMNLNDKKDNNNNNQINYELIDTSYFKNLISIHHDLLNSEKIRSKAYSSKKPPISKGNKKKISSQRKKYYKSSMCNNKKEEDKNVHNFYCMNSNAEKDNNLYFENINLGPSPIKNKILDDFESYNIDKGNYSIDYIRGKSKKFHSNINLSGYTQVNIKSNNNNNLEQINRIEKKGNSMIRTKSAKKIFILKKNLQNEIFNKEKKVEKNIVFETVKKILLYPYFLPKYPKNINYASLKRIQDDIDIYVQKKNFKYQCQDKEHVFIISKRNGYKFDNITQKRIYILPKNKTGIFIASFKSENNVGVAKDRKIEYLYSKDESIENIDLNLINNDINNTEVHNSENSLSKNSDKAKLIKDCFILCYTNKNRISKDQLDKLDKIFLEEEYKLFFANLILPDIKIKKTKNHKQLTSTSFEDLGKILILSLEHLTSNEFNTCRLLTISTFVYYKIENKKLIYLYENFIHGIYPCCLWLSEEFWKHFFKLEFEEEKKNENDLLNLYKYNFNGSINYIIDIEKNLLEKNRLQIILETITFMSEIMVKLKLSKKFILNTFQNNLLELYVEDMNKMKYLLNHIKDIIDKF